MNILGISCYYHDAAAALVNDQGICAAAEEERFSRIKHDASFPEQAIRFCLRQGNISWSQVDAVTFYEKPVTKMLRQIEADRLFGSSGKRMPEKIEKQLQEGLNIEARIRNEYGFAGDFFYSEHHLSHAASAFFPSPFYSAAILTIDGVGEKATSSIGRGKGRQIEILREMRYPHSLGLLYSAITAFLGFKVNNDEYKVMGLASYGTPAYLEQIRKLACLNHDGSVTLDLDYFAFQAGGRKMYTEKLTELFGPERVAEMDNIEPRHMDIAASVQAFTEEAMIKMAAEACRLTGERNLCMAGGVALNGVANWKVHQQPFIDGLFIQPAAGDGGGALGAALLAAHHIYGMKRRESRHSTLLGPQFEDRYIASYLTEKEADFIHLDDEALFEKVADLLYQNQIVAWFQGRMEYGPRALGNRSILANPCNPEMQDILNRRVKFREDFRPFAPAVQEERAREFFDIDSPSPYMLLVPQVRAGAGEKIPAVTHTDNSARVQTVSAAENKKFWNLLAAFEKKSGIPVLINTSFNVRGEPIVCTPEDAYLCYLYTDIDYLVMGNYLINKEI